MSTTLQPLAETRRDPVLDILRGFAMAGVLFMFCVNDIGTSQGYAYTLADNIINWPKYLLVENRMYTMLILIFGIGFHVQLEKARQNQVSMVPAFTRRLAGLLVIGFLHAIFLSNRDILMFYGLAGLALLPMRNASHRQFLILLMVVFLMLVTPALQIVSGNNWVKAHQLTKANNYADHLQYNWAYFKLYHQSYLVYIDMLFHFMLGFWIGKAGILQKLKANEKFRRRLLAGSLVGTILMIPLYYFWLDDLLPPLMVKMNYLARFLTVSAVRIVWQVWMMVSVTLYVTILISLASTNSGRKRLRPLAAFGQMALSNYLIQSLVLVPYFLAFDKYGHIPPFQGFIQFLIVLAAQLVFSTWWMSHYTLGPFEWLLRSITYWRWQPIRKQPSGIANIPVVQNA